MKDSFRAFAKKIVSKFINFRNNHPLIFKSIQIICFLWVCITLSTVHILGFNNLILTPQTENAAFGFTEHNINDANPAFEKYYKNLDLKNMNTPRVKNELIVFNNQFNTDYLCKANSGVDFTYTCTNIALQIIVSYIPLILTFMFFGFVFPPYLVLSVIMALPFIIVLFAIKNLLLQTCVR